MIVKRGSYWFLYSKDGTRVLGGPYASKAEAETRERQVQYFKRKAK